MEQCYSVMFYAIVIKSITLIVRPSTMCLVLRYTYATYMVMQCSMVLLDEYTNKNEKILHINTDETDKMLQYPTR